MKIGIKVFICAVMLAFGFILGIFLLKPMNDSEFAASEEVAQNVYEQISEGAVLFSDVEGFDVEVSTTAITVHVHAKRGAVKARVNGGELIIERDYQQTERVMLSVFLGWVCLILSFLILNLVPTKK